MTPTFEHRLVIAQIAEAMDGVHHSEVQDACPPEMIDTSPEALEFAKLAMSVQLGQPQWAIVHAHRLRDLGWAIPQVSFPDRPTAEDGTVEPWTAASIQINVHWLHVLECHRAGDIEARDGWIKAMKAEGWVVEWLGEGAGEAEDE